MQVFKILQDLGIRFVTQQPVQTRFREYPYIVDFLVLEPKLHVIEVLGRRFHDRTKRQRVKVDVKRECLSGEGFKYFEVWDDELKTKQGREAVKEKVKQFLNVYTV